MQGIADFARGHGGWTFSMWSESYTVSLQSLQGFDGDGIVAFIDTESEARAARELSIPIVNLSGALCDIGIPRVMIDHQAVGCLAAEHLLQCGFRQFAFYGMHDLWYVELRLRGFAQRVERNGYRCATHLVKRSFTGGQPWHREQAELELWLRTLDLPVGLMACTDYRARKAVEACDRLGLKVPDNVGIIGVDNDELICEFCAPTLSSVSRSDYRVGLEAASLLNRLMSGKEPAVGDMLIPPDGIVQRQSTDIVGVNDPYVAVAVRYIRENLDKPFGVKWLAAQLPVSRRCLEQGFRNQLGYTPYEYLSQLRVQRAKQLLCGPERLKINQIARECGFNNPLQLRRAFFRATGVTPQKFRQSIR